MFQVSQNLLEFGIKVKFIRKEKEQSPNQKFDISCDMINQN